MTHKIILLSGKQGSGKSTMADSLAKVAESKGFIVERTRFAKVLYEMHDAVVAVAKKYGIKAGPKEGEMLQWLGTEWGRNLKGENVWVDALRHEIDEHFHEADRDGPWGNTGQDAKFCFIIDDMRFPNELTAFNRGMKDGYSGRDVLVHKVRLEASKEVRKARCSYWRENDQHPSETALDKYVTEDHGIAHGFDLLVRTDIADAAQCLKFVSDSLFGDYK